MMMMTMMMMMMMMSPGPGPEACGEVPEGPTGDVSQGAGQGARPGVPQGP